MTTLYLHGTEPQPCLADAVAEMFCVPVADVIGTCRTLTVARARQVGMFVLRDAGATVYEAAAAFNRHHTTALHAFTTVKRLMDTDEDFCRCVNYVKLRHREITASMNAGISAMRCF